MRIAGYLSITAVRPGVADVDTESNRLEWPVYLRQGNRVEHFRAPGATERLLEYRTGSSSGLQPVSG